jgi:hypothetical protein
MREAMMRPGTSGMFGGGIYFAETVAIAKHKSASECRDNSVIVTATLDLGKVLVLEGPCQSLTKEELLEQGFNSVKGRSSPKANWEYVVYDSSQVHIISVKGTFSVMPQSRAKKWVCDIKIVSGNSRDEALAKVPRGWIHDNQDLCLDIIWNRANVFLAWKMTNDIDEAITNIQMEHFSKSQDSGPSFWVDMDNRRYTRVCTDLHAGKFLKHLYLSYTKDKFPGHPPVCKLTVTVQGLLEGGVTTKLNENWEYVRWRNSESPSDANKGVIGSHVYIGMLKE